MSIPKFRKRKSQLLSNRPSIVLFLHYVCFSLSSKFSYLDIYIFVKNTLSITLNRNMILWHLQLSLYPNVSLFYWDVEYAFFDNSVDRFAELCGILTVYFIIINCCRFGGLKNTHLLIHNFLCPKLGTIHLAPLFKLSQGWNQSVIKFLI